MPSLAALHLENLRRVRDFSALSQACKLKYLSIEGTFDWKQPIGDFEFLRGLSDLEVLRLGNIKCDAPSPALLAAASMKNLKKIEIQTNSFQLIDYAILQAALPNVEGAKQQAVSRRSHHYIPVPENDIRSRLPEDVINEKYPEVIFTYKGREIPDPAHEFYYLLGKGQRSISCKSRQAEQKRREHEARYAEVLQVARQQL